MTYTFTGPRLVDMGYSAIPCRPGDKVPGLHTFGEWQNMRAWSRYCDRLPTHYETSIWSRWPDAGICVVCDHALKVIDVDTDDVDLRAAIEAVLPDSSVKKRGKKGYSAFYRGSPDIAAAAFNIAGGRAIDLLAYGRQTVVPPTTHPETGQPYIWITEDTLEDTPPERLPELPDDIVGRLVAALQPFGYQPPPLRAAPTGDGDHPWSQIKAQALANLGAWVPELGLQDLRRYANGYHSIASFRPSVNGRAKRGRALSIQPVGIYDHSAACGMSPIDLAGACLGMSASEAVVWLEDRLGIIETPPRDFSALIRNGIAKRRTA
ncbi:bifunctional DNA primase/polymerase [Bradyrhizobium sp. LeoA1S1]